MNEETRKKLSAAGRKGGPKGGKAKVPKGFAISGLAKQAGSKGGKINAQKWKSE